MTHSSQGRKNYQGLNSNNLSKQQSIDESPFKNQNTNLALDSQSSFISPIGKKGGYIRQPDSGLL